MRKAPTLKDIARSSGLAVSTVSAVCRGRGDFYHISRKTQAKVLQVAEEIGYRPNRLAVSLKTGVSNFVPVLGRTYQVPITQQRQNRIAQLLRQAGFQVLMNDFHWFEGKEKELLASVREIPFAGLVVSDLSQSDLRLQLRPLRGQVPCILVDSCQPEDFDHVYLDRTLVAYLATRHLLQDGYQRIVYTVPWEREFWLLKERRQGFIQAMEEAGRPVGPENFVWVEKRKESSYHLGVEIGQKIAEAKKKPEAVIALNDQVAIGLMRAFQIVGIRVPEDIAVVGSENLPEGEFCQVPLTSIDFQIEQMAQEVLNLFQKRFSGDWSDFPKKIVLSPKLVTRQSCGCFLRKNQTREVEDEKEGKN